MRLLLTRAAADAARTRERLAARGHEVLVSPVIEMVATGAAWPEGAADGLVATSAQAFELLPADTAPPETRRVVPLAPVGARTAAAARARGFAGPATVADTAGELVARLRDTVWPARPLYLAGRDRKPTLERAFADSGRPLDILVVYEAREVDDLDPVAVAAIREKTLDGVLHYSRRSAALLLALAMKESLDLASIPHLCLSEDVAAPLREAGCGAVHVAAVPTEDELIATVGRL